MIAVFLNNKLIAADTVLPLLLEFRVKWPRRPIEFYCFDAATERAIRANIIISDAIDGLGVLRMIGRRKTGGVTFIAHRLRAAAILARLMILALLGQVSFVHFKALNAWPLRLLYLANRRHTFYIQPSAVGASAAEKRVDEINRPRRVSKHGPAATALVAFSRDWPPLHDPRAAGLPQYILPPPYNRQLWHRHLDGQAEHHLGQALRDLGHDPKTRFVVFILSSMDPTAMLTRADMFPQLFADTLDAITTAIPDVPVLIKPHPATHEKYLALQRQAIAARAPAPLAVTNLHPLLLSRGAHFFIGNVFSSTFANAIAMGLPTVEYTSYNAASLAATDGKSIHPDLVCHFINGDSAALQQTITGLVRSPPPPAPSLVAGDPQTEAFLAALGGGDRQPGTASPNPRSLEA